jgi:hypothetical protein
LRNFVLACCLSFCYVKSIESVLSHRDCKTFLLVKHFLSINKLNK